MDIFEMVIITLQITTILARKKHKGVEHRLASDESIENLLYYKDCKSVTTSAPIVIREPPVTVKQPDCPCPRVCCSMCCDCENNNDPRQSFVSRQMAPLQTMSAMAIPASISFNNGPKNDPPPQQMPSPPRPHSIPVQPQIQHAMKKKKMNKPPINPMLMQPPMSARRDAGFTRENIKNLIARDQDIKKILKDLVRVTMHKVDLVEQVKSRRSMPRPPPPPAPTEPPAADDDDEELE